MVIKQKIEQRLVTVRYGALHSVGSLHSCRILQGNSTLFSIYVRPTDYGIHRLLAASDQWFFLGLFIRDGGGF